MSHRSYSTEQLKGGFSLSLSLMQLQFTDLVHVKEFTFYWCYSSFYSPLPLWSSFTITHLTPEQPGLFWYLLLTQRYLCFNYDYCFLAAIRCNKTIGPFTFMSTSPQSTSYHSYNSNALRISTFTGVVPPSKNEATFSQWVHEVRDALGRFSESTVRNWITRWSRSWRPCTEQSSP